MLLRRTLFTVVSVTVIVWQYSRVVGATNSRTHTEDTEKIVQQFSI